MTLPLSFAHLHFDKRHANLNPFQTCTVTLNISRVYPGLYMSKKMLPFVSPRLDTSDPQVSSPG